MTVLQTKQLTLTPCTPDDRADFIALESDPAVMRFLNGGHAVGKEESDPDATFLMPRGTEPHVWTVRRTATGTFVGWICLWPETARLAELGYRLRQAEWGHGFASESAATLVNWGFESAGYDTITACTMAVNHPSRRVMEKLGMRHTRTVAVTGPDIFPGCEQGEVWYELNRSDWKGG